MYAVQNKDEHDIHILGRKSVEVTGVSSVESFDTGAFSLITCAGPLIIQGSNLHMKTLDLQTGVVIIEGTVTSLSYTVPKDKKRKLTGALFR
ncbi:sporulation protein YabP [Alicyclobacillus pomorum]